MDQEHASDSVYTLLTELCESFQLGPQKLKKFRAHSYELLLSKVHIKNPRSTLFFSTNNNYGGNLIFF